MSSDPVEVVPSQAEMIAFAYRTAAQGDPWEALVQAIEDALTDIAEAERRLPVEGHLVSHGYVRGRFTARRP